MRSFSVRGISKGIVAAALLLGACAAPPTDDPEALAEFEKANDPIEPFNRAVFGFNRTLDGLIFKPAATVYLEVVPEAGREGISNALHNVRSPVILANDVLQGKSGRAGVTLARAVVNSTIGVLGFIDVAAEFDLPGHDEDFGQTLAVWGVGEGPYLMLPVLGPSNPRDGVGLYVDSLIDPFNRVVSSEDGLDMEYLTYVRSGLSGVDRRSRNLDSIDQIERTSLDFYSAIRSLHRQRRADEISDGKPSAIEPAPTFADSPGAAPGAG